MRLEFGGDAVGLQQQLVDPRVGDGFVLQCGGGKVAPKHRFLLCTDGVWEPLTPEEILSAVHDSDPAEACDTLVQLALARGGRDNLTTLLVEIADAQALAAEAAARDEDTLIEEPEQ